MEFSRRRKIPGTELEISPVSMGCWPIAGISSLEVNDIDSQATIEAALEMGVNHFDTAYSYGYEGQSDRLLQRVLKGQYDASLFLARLDHTIPATARESSILTLSGLRSSLRR